MDAAIVTVSAVVAVGTAFLLRTRAPARVVAILLSLSGMGLAWGGLTFQRDPSVGEWILAIGGMAILAPLHVRVVLGPFGPRKPGNPGPHFELLEHTADIGVRARADTAEEAFAGAAEGLASILGAWFPGQGRDRTVEVEAADRAALAVAWLDELLYLHEARDAVFGGFHVEQVGDRGLRARVRLAPVGDRVLEGQGVKAATYHRLRVAEESGAWVVEVYLDV